MLIQFSFFAAYFVVSAPSGLAHPASWGTRTPSSSASRSSAAGCLGFYPAAASGRTRSSSAALFVLASGFTLLQVAANPYAAILGAQGDRLQPPHAHPGVQLARDHARAARRLVRSSSAERDVAASDRRATLGRSCRTSRSPAVLVAFAVRAGAPPPPRRAARSDEGDARGGERLVARAARLRGDRASSSTSAPRSRSAASS